MPWDADEYRTALRKQIEEGCDIADRKGWWSYSTITPCLDISIVLYFLREQGENVYAVFMEPLGTKDGAWEIVIARRQWAVARAMNAADVIKEARADRRVDYENIST